MMGSGILRLKDKVLLMSYPNLCVVFTVSPNQQTDTLQQHRLCRFRLSRQQRLIGCLCLISAFWCMFVQYLRPKVRNVVDCAFLVNVTQNRIKSRAGLKLSNISKIRQHLKEQFNLNIYSWIQCCMKHLKVRLQ